MANQQHIEKLNEGIAAWNQWRKENPQIEPDLRNADLSYQDFRQFNLSRVNLDRADLSNANLAEVDLQHASLVRTNLTKANFCGGNLQQADLAGAFMARANFRSACLTEANLRNAYMSEAWLAKANLSAANLRRADLFAADLREALLVDAKLIKANLGEVLLEKADLTRAELTGADFKNAHLNDANLSGTVLPAAKATNGTLQNEALKKISNESEDSQIQIEEETDYRFDPEIDEPVIADDDVITDDGFDQEIDEPEIADSDVITEMGAIVAEALMNEVLAAETDILPGIETDEETAENETGTDILPDAEVVETTDEAVQEISEEALDIATDEGNLSEEASEENSDKVSQGRKKTLGFYMGDEDKSESETADEKTVVAETADDGFENTKVREEKSPWPFRILGATCFAILAAVIAWQVGAFHKTVDIIIPKVAKTYVFFNGQAISPLSESDGEVRYRVDKQLPGDYDLKVYSTQLSDLDTLTFLRYKTYQQVLNIGVDADTIRHLVQFDTLYSIRKISEGNFPSLNAAGTKMVYIKRDEKKRKKLMVHDLEKGEAVEIKIRQNWFYTSNWEWDRPFLTDEDVTVYLSEFSYGRDQALPFQVSLKSGKLTQIPLKLDKKWLRFVPLNNQKGIAVENKIYSIKGKLLKHFTTNQPFKDAVYPGTNNELVFFTEESGREHGLFRLNCLHSNPETSETKMLFSVFQNRVPFISASKNGDRAILTEYSSMSVEFLSTVKIWANGQFADLTPKLRDGERKNGSQYSFHKTEALCDGSGRKIVFEYEGSIFLIDIPENVTISDLVDANLETKATKALLLSVR